MTYKELYNKKYGYKQNESHNLSEISKDSNVSIKGLQQIYNKGIGAYKTNPQSVRPNVTSKEQWAMARVYSAVMGGKATKVDANELKMKDGGDVSKHSEIYNKWKKLVNMSAAELKTFMDSADGKKAGLSKEQADKLGINYGRESAKWIIKMKQTPIAQWTDKMWYWANRQISFNSRMKGNKGELFDENGNKTRKHLSLLIWGHNPLKYADGGLLNFNNNRLFLNGKDIGLFEYTKRDNIIEIDRLYIKNENQKKGLGRKVIQNIFTKNLDVKKILVYPLPSSESFWLRFTENVTKDGYFEITRKSFEIGNKKYSDGGDINAFNYSIGGL